MNNFRPLVIALLQLPETATDREIEWAALDLAARQGKEAQSVTLSAIGAAKGPAIQQQRRELVTLDADEINGPDADDAEEKVRKLLRISIEDWNRFNS